MVRVSKARLAKVKGPPRSQSLLLGALVVVATTAAILFLRGDGSGDAEDAPVEEIDVSPIVAHGRIASASWGHADVHEEPAAYMEDHASMFDSVDWRILDGDADPSAKRKDGVEKVIEDINGLGVYVAPPEKADPNGPKQQ